jgi:RING finger protein 113A
LFKIKGGGATAYNETDTAHDRDARAILERNVAMNEEGSSSGLYRGQAAYTNYITKKKEQISNNKFTGTQGPIRAPKFFRASIRIDHNPEICKDYKETGVCGYGDSCKFIHDRGDYKAGWQIEKEYKEEQRKKQRAIELGLDEEETAEESYVIESDDEELPLACFICNESFVDAVSTRCGHYFCEPCALGHYGKTSKCACCGKQTSGVFNVAAKLREKMAELKAEAAEDEVHREDSSDDDDNGAETGRISPGGWTTVS